MSMLCLDVGNSHIFGGVFNDEELQLRFRHDTGQASTSDQLGIFLKSVLRENNIEHQKITAIGISSVVPSLDHSLLSACIKYFSLTPFLLQAGTKTGLQINTKNPAEVGSDAIATAIAAVAKYPRQNIIIIDFGTATAFTVVSADKVLLGRVIQAGIRTAMHSLQVSTANLPAVRIVKPKTYLGRATVSCIQSGLYYSQLGAVREIVRGIAAETFADNPPIVIGTGGFSVLFEQEQVFHTVLPDLVLEGLRLAWLLNRPAREHQS